MGKSAFNKLAEQYIVTKNAVNKEVSRQLEVIVAETTDGDDMDEIALKLKAMLKGYREIRTDLTTDAWVDFIAGCRNGIPHSYDTVEGPMADDQIWNFVTMKLFINI